MATLNRRQARIAIANFEPFKGSNVYGVEPFYEGMPGLGMLNNPEDVQRYREDAPQYVVKSYNTPIAWYSDTRGWYKVKQKFSVTTSCHWGLVPSN